MSGSAAFDPNAAYTIVPPAAQAPAPKFDPSASYSVYPMAPTAPVSGQAGTYSNLPAQDVAPFEQGQAPQPGQGVQSAPPPGPTPAPLSPTHQPPGPTLTITPDQAQPPVVGAALAPTAAVPQAPPAAPLPPSLPGPEDDGTPQPPVAPQAPAGPQYQAPASQAFSAHPMALQALQGAPSGGTLPQPEDSFVPEGVSQLGDAITQGMTGSWAPELGSALSAAVPAIGGSQAQTFGQRYMENLATQRAKYAAVPEATKAIGETLGAIPTFLAGGELLDAVPGINALSEIGSPLRQTAVNIAKPAVTGATVGAVQGAGSAGPDDRLGGAYRGAVFGGVTGGGLGSLSELGPAVHAAADYGRAITQSEQPVKDAAGNVVSDVNPDGSPRLDAQGAPAPLMAKPVLANVVGRKANAALEGDAAGQNALSNINENVPGEQPTSGQLTGNKRLIAMETQTNLNPKTGPMVVERRELQAAAQQKAAQALGGGGDVEGTVRAFQQHRDALEKATIAMQEAPREASKAAGAAIPAGGTQAERGAALAAGPRNWEVEQREIANRLYGAAKGDKALMMDATPIAAAQRKIMDELSTKDLQPEGDEAKAINEHFAPLSSMHDVGAYSSRLGVLISKARRAGDDRTVGRLSVLKKATEDAMDSSIERQAAKPGNAIIDRIKGLDNGSSEASATERDTEVNGRAGPSNGTGLAADRGNAGSAGRTPSVAAGNRGLAASATASRAAVNRSGPSLLSFLARRGGIAKDQSVYRGELGQIFDKASGPVGLLRRVGGHTLDHAREMAEEAGYLKPGSDINELLDAITRENAGDKVYPAHIAADRAIQAQHDENAVAEENAAAGAREDVRMSADDLGVRLSPDEVEHATDLVMSGAHPEDALRAVTGDTEAVEAGSQVATKERPQIDEPVTPEALARRDAAISHYREFKTKADQSVVAAILKKDGRANFVMQNESVPDAVIRPGDAGGLALKQYLSAGGSPAAAVESAAAKARSMAVNTDGTINPKGIADFRKGYSGLLSHPAMKELRAKLSTAEGAAEEMGRVAALADQHLKDFQTSQAARYLNATGTQDAARVFKTMIGATNATTLFKRLMTQVGGDAAARGGIKQMGADYIHDNFMTTTKVGTSETPSVKADGFKKMLASKRQVLEQIYDPHELEAFDRLAKSLDRTAKSGALRTPGESVTAHNTLLSQLKGAGAPVMAVLRTFWGPLTGLAVGRSLDGAGGAGIGLALGAIQTFIHTMHVNGVSGLDELEAKALLHPAILNILAANAKAETAPRLIKGLSHAVTRATANQLQGEIRRPQSQGG